MCGSSCWLYSNWRLEAQPHTDSEAVTVSTVRDLLADEATRAKWAERVPEGFVMHVKAFGMMTRHPVKADVLPPELRDASGPTIGDLPPGLPRPAPHGSQ